MSLPIPNLDDKTFEGLVEEARKLIPIYAPQWTDHNLSDPGITLIDLFAWLSELGFYSLNVIDDRHLLKYLALLGMKPRPASPARVELQLTPDTNNCVIVSKDASFKTALPGSTLVFESEDAVEILPITLEKVLSYFNYRYTDVTKFNDQAGTYYHAFGKSPEAGDALYLGLTIPDATDAPAVDLAGKKAVFAVYPYEEDLPPVGEGLPGEEYGIVAAPPPAEVTWECWNVVKSGKSWDWVPLTVTADDETVPILSGKGFLTIDLPANLEIPESKEDWPDFLKYLNSEDDNSEDDESGDDESGDDTYLWLRCRLKRAGYEIPPRLDRVLPNVVSAVEGETADETWQSSGLPNQVFKTKRNPVVPGSQTVKVGNETWQTVEDFDASGPGDPHYLIQPQEGEIHFGDGIYGAVPSPGQQVTIHYRIGGGIKGNVEVGTIKEAGVTGVKVTNPFPGHGGREAETIKDTFVRLQKDLRVPYTAVTAEDYEKIARSVPGLRVARARAVFLGGNRVTVVVMPYSFLEKPLSGEQFKQTVCQYLDLHRLVTTAVTVSDPDYVKVSVTGEIKIKEGYQSEQMKERIIEALDRFLSPLKRESGDNEWPFGRPVYCSEINEVLEGVEGVDCIIQLSLSAAEGSFEKKEGNIKISPLSVVYPGTHRIEIIHPHMKCRGINQKAGKNRKEYQ